ncbi:MAG: HEAT repeat domain-containing protein [Planctomycetes bacterium]|nr:HEAT repeat domain-containing protein [Planctomycetota bacterium]
MLRLLALLLLSASVLVAEEETLDSMVKKTDPDNADAVFALAEWCGEHNLPTKSRQYYKAVLKIDTNHEAARTALGFVRVGDKWVSAQHLKEPAPGKGPEGGKIAGSGPAPSADQIHWDLAIPKDPEPENPFITDYINRLPGLKNDCTDMDNAVATMGTDANMPMAIPRLCAALARPDYGDIFGASNLAMDLIKNGRADAAKPLLPFIVKASEHITDAGDLEAAAFAMGKFRDRRALPRLIELMDHKDDTVKETAANAVSMITMLPQPVTKAKAAQWWSQNHAIDEKTVFMTQLKSSDPMVSIEAARALYELREKAMVPVVIKLLRSDDRAVTVKALQLLVKITGRDWSYDPAMPKEARDKRVDLVEKWWKDEGARFVFVADVAPKKELPVAPVAQIDQEAEWVRQLGSIEGNLSQQAEANLLGKGNASVQALLNGLDDQAVIIRRKCHDILRSITKQDFQFDPRAEPAARAKPVAAWRDWAAKKGLLKDEEGDAEPTPKK